MPQSLGTDDGKMGHGVLRFSPHKIVAIIDPSHANKRVQEAVGLPFETPIVADVTEAIALGARVLVLGTAPSGGRFPESWVIEIEEAISQGMSLVNGLHDDLQQRFGHLITGANDNQFIWNVRKPLQDYGIASAKASKLNNKRVLFIGTDMAAGKMTAGLEIYKWLLNKNISTDFLATGQIGITVTGKGIPLDAIKVDQAAGAVEHLVLGSKDRAVILVEGQGSLLHPSSTATLPLLRGSCPTHLILCHRATMTTIGDPPYTKIPDLKKFIALNEAVASVCGSLSTAKCVGIALNTFGMDDDTAKAYVERTKAETRLAVTDVVRYGAEDLGRAILDT